MKLLRNLKEVKAKPLTNHKAEILEGLREGVEDVQLIKQGKLKGILAKQLLDEL